MWPVDKYLLDLIVIIVITIFFCLTGYRPPWWRRKCWSTDTNCSRIKTVKDIPGPFALPIFGTRWIYTCIGGFKLEKIHECYEQMFQKYGNVICEQALWNIPVVSIKQREDIEAVLRQNSKYPLRPPTEVISYYRNSRPDRYASIGLVNEQGEAWYKLRTALTPELTSAKTITSFVPELNAIIDDFISLLRKTRNPEGCVENLEELANRMGLESTCALILGRRMGFLDNNVDEKAGLLAKAVQEHFCASRDTFYGLPFWKFFKTTAYKKLTESEDTIYNIISELVDTALVEQTNTCQVDAVKSVFMSMLQATGIDVREKKAAIIDFIAAGIQTLGNTLVFLLHALGNNEKVQEKLVDELSEITALDANSINKAHYLRACIAECFRVSPTANCIARILETEVVLTSGYRLPAGTVVLCHTALACLDESNFADAREFNPERWMDQEANLTNTMARYLVVPFGIGRRMCPGKRFIKQELLLILAKIVKELNVVAEDPLELQFEFLVSPKGPVRMKFTDRY